MITYQEIYDILRKEKYNEALQTMPDNFLGDVAAYLSEKKAIVSREGNMFSDTLRITRKQLDNALSIIKEILAIRQRKVLDLAFVAAVTGVSKRDTESLLEHEQELFNVAVKQLEKNQQKVAMVLNGEIREEKDLKNLFVRFKEEVPAFLDSNGNELGPFKKGDVANLPKEIAEILLADNKTALIEEEK
ncbi:MAG: hypothetical protein ACPLXC_01250 [Candidatus Pacearchaeota archaeon]